MTTHNVGAALAVGGDGSGAPARVPKAAGRRGVCLAVVLVLAVLSVGVVSSAVAAQGSAGQAEVRIVARTAASDRVEFALQQRQPDDSWGERLLPSRRLFPISTALGRWLQSSPLTVTAPAPEETPGPTEVQASSQTMAPNADIMEHLRYMSYVLVACRFDIETGECGRIIDGWDAERIIQEVKAIYGPDCSPNLSVGGACDGWDLERWLQRMSELACPEGWYFGDYDGLCHLES